MLRFQEKYAKEIIPALKEEFKYKNVMEVPKLEKICLNMCVSEAVLDSKVINEVQNELGLIAGQKPIVTLAKKSIAAFKLRQGMSIGCKVTLRKNKMYDFLERLVMIALPRVRDFRGFTIKSFDGRGNFSLGMKEHIVFPEINYDQISKVRGLDITINTTTNNDIEAKKLLEMFNVPFIN